MSNPWATLENALPKSGDLSDPGYDAAARASGLANLFLSELKHEMAHNIHRTHDEVYAGALTEMGYLPEEQRRRLTAVLQFAIQEWTETPALLDEINADMAKVLSASHKDVFKGLVAGCLLVQRRYPVAQYKYTKLWDDMPPIDKVAQEDVPASILCGHLWCAQYAYPWRLKELGCYIRGALIYGFSPESLESLYEAARRLNMRKELAKSWEPIPSFRELLPLVVAQSPDLQKIVAGFLSSSPPDSEVSQNPSTEPPSP